MFLNQVIKNKSILELRHTSEELAKDIAKYLQKFNIELKLAGILSDNAANIVRALKDLLQLPCPWFQSSL